MKAPAYPKYKPSSVDWLGDVPEHWDVLATRRVSRRIKTGSTPPTSEERYYEDGSVPWFGPGSFDEKIALSEPVKRLNMSAVNDGAVRLFRIGATMVVTIGATLGKVSSLSAKGSCNQQITVIEFEERRVFPRYGTYQLKRLEGALRAVAPSATLPILAQNDIAEIFMALPPFSEQRIIADFLDAETARLNKLVAKKRELIENLKEKRSALISCTVTRGLPPDAARAAGLDPNPKLKPSGIEWLGEIPEHWEVVPLGYLVRFHGGATPDKGKAEYWEGSIPWVSPKDMKQARIVDVEDHISDEAFRNSPLTMIPIGAVLIVVRGMILAHSFPVALVGAPITINQDMKALVCDKKLESRFLSWALSGYARIFVSFAEESAHGTRKIETPILYRFPFSLPSSREQIAIADYLDRETNKIDRMVAKVEEAIERLQEYRTALITAAVTGKIDVRGYGRGTEAA